MSKKKPDQTPDVQSATPRAAALALADRVDELAAAGVRVFEVGEGATRVRIEFEPGAALLARRRRARVSALAPGRDGDPERADDNDAAHELEADEAEGDDEQAGDDLDLAHTS